MSKNIRKKKIESLFYNDRVSLVLFPNGLCCFSNRKCLDNLDSVLNNELIFKNKKNYSSLFKWPDAPVIRSIPEASPSIHQRIVNGSSASVNQFPWFVSIRSQARNGLQSICGGSLISSEVSS